MKFGVIGCGGLVVLIVLLAIVGAAIGGGGNAPSAPPEEEAEQDRAAEEQPEPEPEPEPAEQPVIVRVTGDPGIAFSGNIGTLEGSRTVDGTTPQDFPVEVKRGFAEFDSVSAVAQNMSDSPATLTVQILEGDEVRKEATTTAAYGVATTTWNPGER